MTVVYRDKAGVAHLTPVPYSDEDELQRTLKEHPELLRDGDEPPLYCLGREVTVGEAGTADLLFIDAEARLSVVEVKLARNQESRRDVLAQAFDYTSALSDYTADELDGQLAGELEIRLQALSGDDVESHAKYNRLWEACANSMRAGAVRVVVAMDENREDLARIVRFVNEHSDLDVRLLVVRKYASSGRTILVPESIVHGGGSAVTRQTAHRSSEPTEHQMLQLEYWKEFQKYMVGSNVKCGPAMMKNMISHPTGNGAIGLYSVASMFRQGGPAGKAPELRVEFGVQMDEPGPTFEWFKQRRKDIEAALGAKLVWDNETYARYYRAYLPKDGDMRERDKWPEQHMWLRVNIEKMYKVFMPLIKEYEASA